MPLGFTVAFGESRRKRRMAAAKASLVGASAATDSGAAVRRRVGFVLTRTG
jgi:hypothetical protein